MLIPYNDVAFLYKMHNGKLQVFKRSVRAINSGHNTRLTQNINRFLTSLFILVNDDNPNAMVGNPGQVM